jgi:methylosome protein 50
LTFSLPDGKLAIGSSKLTGRYWNGSLWLFKTPDQAPDSIYAPDNKHCSCCASTNAGCTDLTWLDKKRLAFASDNGIIELWCTGESFNEVEILANLTGHDDIVQSISVNCDRVKIVSGSLDMRLVKYCDDNRRLSPVIVIHTNFSCFTV